MNYYNKYIKYKNKYLIIKNQIGSSSAAPCIIKKNIVKKVGCDINFTNNLGTCWCLSILMILLYSDSTSNCVQYKLNKEIDSELLLNKNVNELLIKLLPHDIYVKNIEIIQLLNKLEEKFEIKKKDQLQFDQTNKNTTAKTIIKKTEENKKRRRHSKILEDEFSQIYSNLINEYTYIHKYGGDPHETFFLINILSCTLLQRLITFNTFFVNKHIDISLLKNTIGIIIAMPEHICSFYICNDIMKFCNNELIINHNWLELFDECNKLKNRKYKVYLKKYDDTNGPFIHDIDNNKIKYFNDNNLPYIRCNINVNNTEYYYNITSFVFLTYDKIKDNFFKKNDIYYLNYYSYSDNIDNYINYIDNIYYIAICNKALMCDFELNTPEDTKKWILKI